MGILHNVWERLNASPKSSGTSSAPLIMTNNLFGTGKVELQKDPVIFSVITRLAGIIASMNVDLYDADRKHIRTDSIDRLVSQQANPVFSSYDVWHKAEVDRNEFGNAYVFIQYDEYLQPKALWNLDHGLVMPFINSDDSTVWYKVQGQNGAMYVPAYQMIHLKHLTGSSRVVGISPIDVLQGSADYNEAFNKFSLNEMSKRDGFTIKFDKNIDDTRKKAVALNVQAFIKDNSGVLFSEPGMEVDTIDRKIATADVARNDDTYIRRVANVFNVPLIFLNSGDQGSGYRDSEEHFITFVEGTILPIVRQYESELNMKLLTDSQKEAGFYFKFDTNVLLRGNTAARTAYYQMLIRNGIASPEYIQELEGIPINNQAGANKLWISGDLYPTDATMEERTGKETEDNDVLSDESDG